MFDTVRFFRGYRRCFICRISHKSCLLSEYSIFSNYSDFRRSPKMIVLVVELVEFLNTDLLNDVRFHVAFSRISCACFDGAWVGFPEIGCSTQSSIFPELITNNQRCCFRRTRMISQQSCEPKTKDIALIIVGVQTYATHVGQHWRPFDSNFDWKEGYWWWIRCSTQCSIFPEVITDNQRYSFS